MVREERPRKNQQHQINRDSRKSQGRERPKKQGRTTNKEFARVTYVFVALFLVMMGYIGYFTVVIRLTLLYIFSLSISFFVFNLIPVFPLDGFRIYDALAKRRGGFYRFLRFQGIYVLYFLLFLSVIADFTGLWQLNILGIALNFVAGYLQIPITAFWGLIF